MFLISNTILGLPTHPLVVHLAVVLIPLAALSLVSLGWRGEWRRHYAPVIAVLACVGAIAAFIATQTGGSLEHAVRTSATAAGAARPNFGDHPSQGDNAQFFAIALAIAAVALSVVDRWRERLHLPKWSVLAVYGVSVIPAVAAVIFVVMAGHSGATLVWKDVGTYASSSR